MSSKSDFHSARGRVDSDFTFPADAFFREATLLVRLFCVAVVAGINLEDIAFLDVKGNLDHGSGLQGRGLGSAHGVALEGAGGLGDLEDHEGGKLDALTTQLLFSPTRPAEELYEWTTDRWQVKNLAASPTHQATLETLRARLDRWIADTKDRGPESDTMFDSDMKVYLGRGNPEVERNIALMKRWAAEGK